MDFEQLYTSYYKQVFSYAMTLAKERTKAEDITQEAFSRAISNHEKYNNKSSELTWLCSIAKNFYIDELRKKSKETDFPENYEVASEEDVLTQITVKDDSFRIHVLLHEMEEPYKEVFQLRVFGDLSFDKIGNIFGKTENWARVTYHRAKLKIQERMNADE